MANAVQDGLSRVFYGRPLDEYMARLQTGHPENDQELMDMMFTGVPLDGRYLGVGVPEGAEHWSWQPGMSAEPDDVELEQVSPLVRRDPDTGMMFAHPEWSSGAEPGLNYADYAVDAGLAEPGYAGSALFGNGNAAMAALRRVLARKGGR